VNLKVSVPVVSALVMLSACGQQPQQKAPEPKQESNQVMELNDRFELHEAMNGMTRSTVLVDRRDGRVWLLTHADTTGSLEFLELTVAPPPNLTQGGGPSDGKVEKWTRDASGKLVPESKALPPGRK